MMRSMLVLVLASATTLVAGVQLGHTRRISHPGEFDIQQREPDVAARRLKVKQSCDTGSWKTTRERYTTTSNRTQALVRGITAPSRILVTKPRIESSSNTMGLSFDHAKLMDTGLELNESVENETELLAGAQTNGFAAFTTYLDCVSGKARTSRTTAEPDADSCNDRNGQVQWRRDLGEYLHSEDLQRGLAGDSSEWGLQCCEY